MKGNKHSSNFNKQAFIFANLFLIANKMQVVCDQYLEKSGLTTKQWFLIAAVQQFREEPPTLSEVGLLIGSSRQNVKQLALKLEKNGFLKMEQDFRAVRLILTDKCHDFWGKREIQDERYIADLFKYLGEEDIESMSDNLRRVLKRLDEVSVEK
ncbi:MAG TPA: MarR family transcriptional regulator [Clostridia bacterium]|nr:MarR family transcriptional regulator [Clostridia bacterium]